MDILYGAFIQSGSQGFFFFYLYLTILTHTFTSWRQRATMQATGLTTRSNFGISVLPKDTLIHGQEEVKNHIASPVISRWPALFITIYIRYKWGKNNTVHTVPYQSENESSSYLSVLCLANFIYIFFLTFCILHFLALSLSFSIPFLLTSFTLLSTIVCYVVILQFNDVFTPLRRNTNKSSPLLCRLK